MDAIRNYLENMFLSLPDTPEIRRAKNELLQMMEDKYGELIAEGRTENEAVGTVISEFGNLDELADTLGIRDAMTAKAYEPELRTLNIDDVKCYLTDLAPSAFRTALGVGLCILCPVGTIVAEALAPGNEVKMMFGVLLLFAFIAVAVLLFVFGNMNRTQWKDIKEGKAALDFGAVQFVQDELERQKPGFTLELVAGILLCVLCAVPAIIAGTLFHDSSRLETLSGGAVIMIVALGVFLIVSSSMRSSMYTDLLKLNSFAAHVRTATANAKSSGFETHTTGTDACTAGSDARTAGSDARPAGRHFDANQAAAQRADFFRNYYWKLITIVYLIYSFISGDWGKSWLIWPVAGILKNILEKQN